MLHWAKQFNIFCFLDSHEYNLPPHQWDCLLAADALYSLDGNQNKVRDIDAFLKNTQWTFGHINYEALHQQYGLNNSKSSPVSFPPFFFFQPRYLLRITNGQLVIDGKNANEIYAAINQQPIDHAHQNLVTNIQSLLKKEQYTTIIKQLLNHILRGDCYEINFCQEFFAEAAHINPLHTYLQLVQLAPNPFCAFYKVQEQYLICASPERFVKKNGKQLLSQPMKGTAIRVPADLAKDDATKKALYLSSKDRSENVMVVDMVRNDLSKICSGVQVKQLFGIQSFPYVHQMVSTITGEVKEGITFSEILKATFPMGSMTGAPKKKVMELIEQYEPQKRGIFSGSVGYITPDGDFDFNVVIRSIMYNSTSGYLSYQVGSGITAASNPQAEWEECMLKGAAIKKVLTGESALI